MVDVRAQPMRVRHRIVGARRNEQPLRVETSVRKRLARMVPVECEAALEASPNLRVMLEPSAMRREVIAVRKAVSSPDPLQ